MISTVPPDLSEPYVAQFPAAAVPFVDRERELSFLSDWAARASKPTLTILGIGGVGKTSLAWEWFTKHSEGVNGFEGRMWWSFYEGEAQPFFVHCHSYLTGIQVADSQALRPRELISRIVSNLKNNRFLLILDGIEREMVAYALSSEIDAATLATSHRIRSAASLEVSDFFRRTAEVHSASKIILTSRLAPAELEDSNGQPIPGAEVLELGGFDEAGARLLLSHLSIVGRSDELINLAAEAQFHPLFISLIARQVARDPAALDHIRAALRSTGSPKPQTFATTILGSAIDRLGHEARRVASYVAAFRDPVEYSTLATLLVGKGKEFSRESELDQALSRLQDLGLVAWNQVKNTYSLHPMVRGALWQTIEAWASVEGRVE